MTLAAIWGSSYFFIKIGVETLPPFSLVAGRLAVAVAFLAGVLLLVREPFPRDIRTLGALFVLAVVNVVVPFGLIAYGEQSIDSGLAAILNATTPFFTLLFATIWLHEDRFTAWRVVGLMVGFGGVIVISSRNLEGAVGVDHLLGDLAIVAASASYGAGNIVVRRHLRGQRPMVTALGQLGLALPIVAALGLIADGRLALPAVPEAVFAIAWLGILGSGIAYLIFFKLLHTWGPTRTALVTYLMPIVAVGLGVAVLAESVDVRFLVGTVLVIAGVALVNARPGAWARLRVLVGLRSADPPPDRGQPELARDVSAAHPPRAPHGPAPARD